MILDKINSPEDLRRLDIEELRPLCGEIRDYIVRCCADNPGHLASSLGAVELIVGLHYVFDTPKDKLVFDVGHQAYAHKILTGRKEAFKKNRMPDGISGFPNRDESEYDAFGAGHASTSISAALGMAEAAKLSGTGEKVVAMIGDGAMTGGLALEGLNNAGWEDTDLLVVLNDNDMAIDGNKGALHSYLLKLTTDPAYNRIKTRIWEKLGAGKFRNRIQWFVRKTKSGLVTTSGGDLFEAFGFRYFGPIDGNDVVEVVKTLRRLKDIKGPKSCTPAPSREKATLLRNQTLQRGTLPGSSTRRQGRDRSRNIQHHATKTFSVRFSANWPRRIRKWSESLPPWQQEAA